GGNDFQQVLQGVEIRLFYSLNFNYDVDECEITLMKLFRQNDWYLQTPDARYTDPDTGQAIKAIYVSRNKNL
ncbi:hypothetical protein Q757_07855, partial [Oenococcus alcoholitolerans]